MGKFMLLFMSENCFKYCFYKMYSIKPLEFSCATQRVHISSKKWLLVSPSLISKCTFFYQNNLSFNSVVCFTH